VTVQGVEMIKLHSRISANRFCIILNFFSFYFSILVPYFSAGWATTHGTIPISILGVQDINFSIASRVVDELAPVFRNRFLKTLGSVRVRTTQTWIFNSFDTALFFATIPLLYGTTMTRTSPNSS